MTKPHLNRTVLITVLGLLAALGPMSIAMYIPGFEEMAVDLGVPGNRVALTITTYFIGITIGQLVFGPLIDRYGRKKPLLWALLLFVAASLGCAWSDSLETLALLRFLQALGGSSGMVASMAIISDVYEPKERAGAFSLVMLVLGVAPIISPTLGSYFVQVFGWQSVFHFLAIAAAVIALAILLLLPETRQVSAAGNMSISKSLADYATVMRTKPFLSYAIGGSLASAVTFVFVASSPLVLMGFYKMNATTFAILYGVSASGVMLGNYLNGLLVRKLPYLKVMARALVALVLCTLAFTAWTGLQPAVPFQVVVAGLFLVLCCIGMIYPNSVSASLAPFKALSGSASALMGSFMMGISALTTALVGILPAGSSTYMFGLMAVMSILSAWMLRGNPGTAPQPTAETV